MMMCSRGGGGGTTDLLQQLEQTLPAHKVKYLGEVDEGNVERHLLLTALLLELSNGEDHVHCGSLASEAVHWESGKIRSARTWSLTKTTLANTLPTRLSREMPW